MTTSTQRNLKAVSIEQRVRHASLPFNSERVMPIAKLREKLLKPEQKAALKGRHMIIEATIWLTIASVLIVMVAR